MTASSKPQKSTLAEPELVIMRVFNAPRELVWKAWTDPKHSVRWWGPKDYPATQVEMDLRVGGVWRGQLRSTEDGRVLSHKGVFREVLAPERLVFTFSWDEDGERGLETLVTVTFADQNGKTLMTFARFRSSRWRNATDTRAAGPAHSIASISI